MWPPCTEDCILRFPHMPARTRPSVIPRPTHQSGPHRVTLHISCSSQCVPFVKNTREITPLPKVSRLRILPVEMLGVTHVRTQYHSCKRVALFRYGHKMDVVGHQAIRKHLNAMFFSVLPDQIQISFSIVIIKKDFRPPVPPLSNMMRKPCRHNPCVKKIGSVPIFLRSLNFGGHSRVSRDVSRFKTGFWSMVHSSWLSTINRKSRALLAASCAAYLYVPPRILFVLFLLPPISPVTLRSPVAKSCFDAFVV
jgi:hypothetical protein